MSASDDHRARTFIQANTRLLRPPLVPEIELHLAEESLPIWRNSEAELGQMNVEPPYWAFAWAGGQALARYILDNPDTVAGTTVLDLGTGSGLVAIAAALAGAAKVTANDIDAYARAACRLNAAANRAALEIDGTDLVAAGHPSTDTPRHSIVCLGDLFYDVDLAAGALAFAREARDAGAQVLAGDPRRSYFPTDRFTRLAEYAVPVTRELEDSEIKNTAVWELLE